MEKTKMTTNNETSWNPQASYEKVSDTINEWPNWKKKAYNEMFAISTHAEKLLIKH